MATQGRNSEAEQMYRQVFADQQESSARTTLTP